MKQKLLFSKKILARAGTLILVLLLISFASPLQVSQLLLPDAKLGELKTKDVLCANTSHNDTSAISLRKETNVNVDYENDYISFQMCLDFTWNRNPIFHKNKSISSFFDLHHLEVNKILYNQSCNILNKTEGINYV